MNKYKIGGTKYKLFKVVKLSKENCRTMYNLTNSYKILVIVSIYLHTAGMMTPSLQNPPTSHGVRAKDLPLHQGCLISKITSYPHNEAVR